MIFKKSTITFESSECLSFGDIEIYYDDSKATMCFQNDIYEFPRELVNANLEISFIESDNDYQDFAYIIINDIEYLYHYDNDDLILTPIEVYVEGEYYFYKEI